jgi:hypothetical protein
MELGIWLSFYNDLVARTYELESSEPLEASLKISIIQWAGESK